MEKIEIEVVTLPSLTRPHNEKKITRIAISPLSKYAVTYSEEDNSFDGWHTKDKIDEKGQNEDKPLKRFFKLNKGEKDQFILDDKVMPYEYNDKLLNFKVSDGKIIMYEDKNNKTEIYDMKNEEKITLDSNLIEKYVNDNDGNNENNNNDNIDNIDNNDNNDNNDNSGNNNNVTNKPFITRIEKKFIEHSYEHDNNDNNNDNNGNNNDNDNNNDNSGNNNDNDNNNDNNGNNSDNDNDDVNHKVKFKFTDFLTNGNLVTYIEFNEFKKSIILIYPSNKIKDKKWICDSIYELNEKVSFGGITNDKLWVLSDESIFILDLLDLSAFQYRKISLKINVDIEKISLKISKSLIVIKVDKIFYIYSAIMDLLMKTIKSIEVSDQEFDIANDEYIIISNDVLMNVYSWKLTLKCSANLRDVVNYFIRDDFNKFVIIGDRFNDKKAIVKEETIEFEKELVMINIEKYDWKTHILNQNPIDNSSEESKEFLHLLDEIDENIFYNIGKQFSVPINENEFINKCIKPNLKNFSEQNEYEIRLKDDNNNEIILEAFFRDKLVSSYNTNLKRWKYSKVNNKKLKWKYSKVNKNTCMLYNETELCIYTFNINFKKIKLHCHYNCEFLKHAIKFYNNEILGIKEIKEIAQPIENNRLKTQWLRYLLEQKYFLVYYGEILLKSAIKQNNIKLVEMIFNKTLKYFRENPKNNIHILSIIFKHMKYLDENYSDFFLIYYNEMILIMGDSDPDISRYNSNFQHLHSFHKGLYLTKINSFFHSLHDIIFESYHLYAKLALSYFISVLLLFMTWEFNNLLIKNSVMINIIVGSLSIIFIICLFLIIIYLPPQKKKTMLVFVVPFPSYMTYPKKYCWFKEFFKPRSSPFSQTQNNEIYKTWNGEAIINFKWRVFSRYYYAVIWFLFTIYLTCFTLASIPSNIFNEKVKEKLFIYSIILGLFHLSFKLRQFIWDPIKFISDTWNWIDLGSFIVPVLTSIYWITSDTEGKENKKITQAISISCLLLDIKFLLFFRAFESFGIYFAIILGVAKRIISFLFIIFSIILSFTHAFLILLRPKSTFSKDDQGDLNDPNNPWVLTKQYHQMSEDGNITNTPFLIEEPDENTNLFSNFPDSLLAMYLFLTGDRTSLESWSPNDNPIMILLMIIFSIGLLNIAIEEDNNRVSYLEQKAEILKEIELFYLFPHQRRWQAWFPDIIYYYADVNKTRQVIKKLMNEGTWKTNYFPEMNEMRENLSKLLSFENS